MQSVCLLLGGGRTMCLISDISPFCIQITSAVAQVPLGFTGVGEAAGTPSPNLCHYHFSHSCPEANSQLLRVCFGLRTHHAHCLSG